MTLSDDRCSMAEFYLSIVHINEASFFGGFLHNKLSGLNSTIEQRPLSKERS
jgi:hypothetical protein